MSSQQGEILCRYPLWWKLWILVLVLPFVFFGLYLAFLAVAGLISATVQLASGTRLDAAVFADCFLALVFALILLSFPVLFLNTYSDVRLSEKGVAVQVFWLWWVFVPWEDVLDIRPTTQARLLRHRRSQLVFVRRLTFLHRFIGWSFGMTPKPAFNIKATQQGYDDAVRLITEKLGKEET